MLQDEIVRLKQKGLTHREIAKQLGISKSGVGFRLNNYKGDTKWVVLTDLEKQVLLGCLLGDSSIRFKHYKKAKTGFCFEFGHATKQLNYLKFKRCLLSCGAKIRHRLRASFDNPIPRWFHTFTYHHRPYLEELHALCIVNGEKTVNRAWLNRLDPLGIALWYQDDGHCRMIGRRRKSDGKHVQPTVRLATNGYKEDQINLIIDYFKDRWDVEFHKLPPHRGIAITARCNNARRFLELVRDYLFLPKMLEDMKPKNIGKRLPKLLQKAHDVPFAAVRFPRTHISGSDK